MKNSNQKPLLAFAIAAALFAAAPSANAFEAGDWLIKIGAHVVNPKSNNGTLAGGTLSADIGSDIKPSIQAEYFFSPNLGLELLASVPFQHDVRLNGAQAVSFKHLPPTLSLQYHFGDEAFRPFIGAGVNYTWTYGQKSSGPLAGTEVSISNSWGLALHGGIDYLVNDSWYLGADLRWIDIDADVRVNAAEVGSVKVDPLSYGVYVGWKF